MASVNKVILIGNLGKDPELRYTQGGQGVCNFTLATNERWKDKEGQSQERTEWHRIVVWGKSAENCAQYLQKGRSCYVEGRLQTREWEDKEGVKKYTTEIVANEMQMLDSRGEMGGGGFNQAPNNQSSPQPSGSSASAGSSFEAPPAEDFDDDIPF